MKKVKNLLKKAIEKTLGYHLIKYGYESYGFKFPVDLHKLRYKDPILTIFDVGANEGNVALSFSRQFPEAKIYCFEPVPETFERLNYNTKSLEQILPYRLALSENDTEQKMYIYDNDHVNSLESKPAIYGNIINELTVHCTSIDRFCCEHNIEQIDFLKLDVEGYEINVLRGAKNLLKENKIKFIYSEFKSVVSAELIEPGVSLLDLNTFLTDYGYRPVIFYTDYIKWNPYRVNFNVLYCNLDSSWYPEGEEVYDESWYGNKK